MAARGGGLGPVRVLGVVLALLVTTLLSGFGTTPAASVRSSVPALAPIDVPMSGKLPICPAQMHTFSPSDVWVLDDLYNNFGNPAELGLLNNCAYQNWQDPDNTSSFPRAVDAKAVPDEISISSEPITVQIQATPVSVPEGGFNNWVHSCMPVSTRPGGCATSDWPGYYVGYRLANGAGEFVGRWTLAGLGQPNPYFDLTRGSCPDQHPEWDPDFEHVGIPCTWTLRFVTTAQGAPVLTTGMQVVLAMHLRSGTQTANGITGPQYDVVAVVPMIFQPGASTALDLQPSAPTVRSGRTLTLTAQAQGPQPGTPVNFYRASAGGGSYLGQALTDSSGRARLDVKMTTSATFYARLVSGGGETTRSPDRTVVATRAVSLKASPVGDKFLFLGKVRPDDGAGKVQLQRLTKKGWKTVERGRVKKGKISWTLDVPEGSTTWRLLTKGTADYGESVSKKKTVSAGD